MEYKALVQAAVHQYDQFDKNCAESLLSGMNELYDLGLDDRGLRTASGLGGGMGIGSVCGALTGAILGMGNLFVKERSHESDLMKRVNRRYLALAQERFGSVMCETLKDRHYSEEAGCVRVVEMGAELAEEVISEFFDQRVR